MSFNLQNFSNLWQGQPWSPHETEWCLWLLPGVPEHHWGVMDDKPPLWLGFPVGHGVHDSILDHVHKRSPNSHCGLTYEQLVQSCKLWLSTRRQVNMRYPVVSAEGYEEEVASVLLVANANPALTRHDWNEGKLHINLFEIMYSILPTTFIVTIIIISLLLWVNWGLAKCSHLPKLT